MRISSRKQKSEALTLPTSVAGAWGTTPDWLPVPQSPTRNVLEFELMCWSCRSLWRANGRKTFIKVWTQYRTGNATNQLNLDHTISRNNVPLIKGMTADAELRCELRKPTTSIGSKFYGIFIEFFVHNSKVSKTYYFVKRFLP